MSHDEENTFEDDTLSLLEPRGLLDAVLGDKGVNFSYIPEVLQEDDRIAWAQSLLGAASIWVHHEEPPGGVPMQICMDVIQIVHKDTYKEIYHNISDADQLGFVAYNKMSGIQVRFCLLYTSPSPRD